MSDLLKKLTKAMDAVADIMTEEESSILNVCMYTYDEFNHFYKKNMRENMSVAKCKLSIKQTKEFDDMVFSEKKYIIKILFLDIAGNPILVKCSQDAYMGLIVIASGIDKKLKDLMGDKEQKTITIKRR